MKNHLKMNVTLDTEFPSWMLPVVLGIFVVGLFLSISGGNEQTYLRSQVVPPPQPPELVPHDVPVLVMKYFPTGNGLHTIGHFTTGGLISNVNAAIDAKTNIPKL